MSFARRQALNTVFLLARSQSAVQALASNSAVRQPFAGSISSTDWKEQQQWGQTGELFKSLTTNGPNNVQNLLDSMQGVKLRDSLDVASESSPFMSYKELLDFIIRNGAADTEDEAHRRADALVHAGVVLRFNGIVYLRPQEVSELVYRVLPTDPAHAQRNLTTIEEELKQMDKQHRQIRSTAQRWPRFWLWTGCAALTLQLVAFTYLTYWELSWDVMEPIAYILSLTYSLLAYVYFLVRGSYFDYGPFEEYWTQQQLEKKMAEKGFNIDRYQHLVRTRDRYRRYLEAQGGGTGLGGQTAISDGYFGSSFKSKTL